MPVLERDLRRVQERYAARVVDDRHPAMMWFVFIARHALSGVALAKKEFRSVEPVPAVPAETVLVGNGVVASGARFGLRLVRVAGVRVRRDVLVRSVRAVTVHLLPCWVPVVVLRL